VAYTNSKDNDFNQKEENDSDSIF